MRRLMGTRWETIEDLTTKNATLAQELKESQRELKLERVAFDARIQVLNEALGDIETLCESGSEIFNIISNALAASERDEGKGEGGDGD